MIFLTILLLIISIIVLVYVCDVNKLKDYQLKMDNAEKIIDKNLKKKQDVIVDISTIIKKLDSKKDYLKEYASLKEEKMNNIERDLKLEEATNLINDFKKDYAKLAKDTDFNKKVQTLREIDEKLVAAKNIYNNNATLNNRLIKTFPYNIISKIAHFKPVTLYNKNEEDN